MIKTLAVADRWQHYAAMKATTPIILVPIFFSLFAVASADDYKKNSRRKSVFARHLQQGKVNDVFSDCQSKLAGENFEIVVLNYRETKPRGEFGPSFHAVADYSRQVNAKTRELVRVEFYGSYAKRTFEIHNRKITHYGVVGNDFDIEAHHNHLDKFRRHEVMAELILDYQAGLRRLVSRYKGFMGVRILPPDPSHLGKKDYRLDVLFDTWDDYNRFKKRVPYFRGIAVTYGWLRVDDSKPYNLFDLRSWEISTPMVNFNKVSENLDKPIRQAIQKDPGEHHPTSPQWRKTYEIHLHTNDEALIRVLELQNNKVQKGVYYAEWSLREIAIATSFGFVSLIELLD